jgi:hypothetical protein
MCIEPLRAANRMLDFMVTRAIQYVEDGVLEPEELDLLKEFQASAAAFPATTPAGDHPVVSDRAFVRTRIVWRRGTLGSITRKLETGKEPP